MENILSSLNGLTESWLTLGSASYHTDLSYTLLSGLGLLLLYICYLILRLLTQWLWRKKDTPKLQEKGKKTRQTLTGEGTCQREAEQRRELRITQQSSLEEPSDATCNGLLLHKGPLFPACDRSGDIGHQLSQAILKDGSASHLCVVSTAPGTEASFILSSRLTGNQAGHPAPAHPPEPLPLPQSIHSPNRFVPLEGFYSSTPLCDSLTPESTLPSNPPLLPDPTPPSPLVSFPPPTKEGQKSKVVFQPETTRPLVDGLNERSTNVPPARGTSYLRQAMAEPSQQHAAGNQLSSDLENSFNQHLPPHHVSQAPLQGNTRTYHLDPGHLFFSNSDALKLLQRLDKKGRDFLMAKEEKEETKDKRCFIKSPSSSERLPLGKPLVEPQVLAASHSESSKGKIMPQLLPHSKTPKDHKEPKPAQLFWGPPSLHSEALHPTTTTSYDRSSTFVCFNSMAEASIADYSHVVLLPTPLSVYRPQTWLQAASQSHPQRDPHAEARPQPQPQPQSPVSVLTLSSQSELRNCGVHFHRPQGDELPLSPCAIQCLEYNILKKEQERVWGLPFVIQKSQDTFCPSPPKVLLASRSSKTCTPRPILPGDFPLTSELEKKLEHHLRKRLIQHRWGLPHRIDESLSLMSPHSELTVFPESKKSHGLSWITFFKYRGSKDSQATVPGRARSSHSRMPERHSPQETVVKEQTYSQDIGQAGHPQGNLQEASQNSLQSHSKTHRKSHAGRRPPKHSSPSPGSQGQKGVGNVLEKHLNKKMREISGGEIPTTVDRSRHSMDIVRRPPETSPKQVKDTTPLAGEEDGLRKHPHSLTLSRSKEKMLEEHITSFGRRMTFGLPQRVEESLESYLTKAESSCPFPQLHIQAHRGPRADSDKSSRSFHRNTTGDKVVTVNSVPTQQRPLPATSLVGHSQPASENNKVCVDKDLSIAPRGREPTQHWTPSMADKGILQQSGPDNRPGPELPVSPDGPTHERLASSTNTQGSQGEKTSWEHGSTAEGATELHKGEQLPGLHPQSTKNSRGKQGLCSPGSHVTACQSLKGMSVPHNSEEPDSKSQVSTEGEPNPEGRPHIQVPDLPATPFASAEMTSKPQGPSSGDMAVSQVLHLHLPTVGINMESHQGPWVPAYLSGKSKNKDCPPAARGLLTLASEAGKLGGGDAGLGTSQTRGKSHCVQAGAPEETLGHTSSPALTPKSQPQENQFTNQAKGFWQRLSPGRKHKGQEKSLAKGCSPLTSVKGTRLIKGRCEFCGNPEAQKCVRDPGMVLRKQLGYRHGTVIPCPQAPVCPLMESEEAQQEVQLQAQAEPVQRLPHFCCKASCSQGQRAECCSPGQGQTVPERCGTTGKAKMVEPSPTHAFPPKSYL
ncbi:spermatogenesis-associated protein 31D4-like [Arvicanthis niloticus]|uniref:spermatogenesis-associated protein 31D4-like n=1 Tax=Arvicanthis niloticus TaxID=61156 RepID=UPI00148642DD|nr:spermatogenesis-associated protein 31D4-like [Arvicanthis niloticus]